MYHRSHFTAILLLILVVASLNAQVWSQQKPVRFIERNLGGPRLGFTLVPGSGELATALDEKNIGRIMSQFGWHFEWQVVPRGGGPSFVVELIPLFAGVEYGRFIPSISLATGIRFPSGIEFGIGPDIMIGGEKKVRSALVIAFGKTFNYSGVSIPVNLVMATNPAGKRLSLILGYAIAK